MVRRPNESKFCCCGKLLPRVRAAADPPDYCERCCMNKVYDELGV